MAAMFHVRFENGHHMLVHSADAKSMKRADLRAATRGAVKKAKAKLARTGIKSPCVECRCVG